MLEETRHGLPQPDSPRYRAMRRQCKRLCARGSEQGGCPCESLSECRFALEAIEHVNQDAIADAMSLAFGSVEFNKAMDAICREDA